MGQTENVPFEYGVQLDRPEEYSKLPSQIFAERERDPAHIARRAELNRLRREHRDLEEQAK